MSISISNMIGCIPRLFDGSTGCTFLNLEFSLWPSVQLLEWRAPEAMRQTSTLLSMPYPARRFSDQTSSLTFGSPKIFCRVIAPKTLSQTLVYPDTRDIVVFHVWSAIVDTSHSRYASTQYTPPHRRSEPPFVYLICVLTVVTLSTDMNA